MSQQSSKLNRVFGPAGEPLTLGGLPPPDVKRWVTRRKAEVVTAVRAVRAGLIDLDEVCARYGITPEEFLSWKRLLGEHGLNGLRATRLQRYRRAEDGPGIGKPRPGAAGTG